MKETKLSKLLADNVALSYDFNVIGQIISRISKYNRTNFVNFTWQLIKKMNILSEHDIEKIWFILRYGNEEQIDYFQDFLVIHLMKYWSKESKKVVEVLETHGCSYHCLLTTEWRGDNERG